jgi:hypothetical protein
MMIYSSSFAQNNQTTIQLISLGWSLVSPLIVNKIKDPLTKEIIIKSIPKLIVEDVKGAVFEVSDAIYRIKNVKVCNKEFLAHLEKNINAGIKDIKQKDYASAVNEVIGAISCTDTYIRTGILDKPDSKSQEIVSAEKSDIISATDVNSKLHLGKNNSYLFFVPDGIFTDNTKSNAEQASTSELLDYEVALNDGKKYNLHLEVAFDEGLKDIGVENFQSNKEANDKFKTTISGILSENLGTGQIIKSEVANYQFKALKYTYQYLDNNTSVSSMANVLIAFHNSSMYLISFCTALNDFPITKKSFEDFMDNFYIIGVDEIATTTISSKPCEANNTGTITVVNNSTNPYDIWVDNTYQIRLAGRTKSKEISIKEGNSHKLYAKQVSGYVLYPTEKTYMLNVVSCSNYNWQVP